MDCIQVAHLQKDFQIQVPASGISGMVKNLFSPERRTVHAVKDISFTLSEGEFVGFVGPNGAGKTTTLKMLSGILHPTSGTARVHGFTPWKREKQFQKQFSLVMGQKNQLWWDLPVRESFEFNRAVYEIEDRLFRSQLDILVELLALSPLLDMQVRQLSLGQRMKCELAASLLHKPRVLFLDEPTIGLDIVSQKSIRDFLTAYNTREKATIILTSHYMEDIRRLCKRVIIIDHGSLIYDGSYRDLVTHHADIKTIELVLSEAVPRHRLEEIGTLSEYRETSARLTVPRALVTEITTRLLKEFPVDDISIHEESMEEIVRGIFLREGK